jgi:hypothetical protein
LLLPLCICFQKSERAQAKITSDQFLCQLGRTR